MNTPIYLVLLVSSFLSAHAANRENLAFKRPLNVNNGWLSSQAVDGSTQSSTTLYYGNPKWVCVQLDNVIDFTEIIVYSAPTSKAEKTMQHLQFRFSYEGGCSTEGFKTTKFACHPDRSYTRYKYTTKSCGQNPFSGRYVFVTFTTDEYAWVAEIIIYGNENLAYRRPGLMSSVIGNRGHETTVDGDFTGYVKTRKENPSWWCVALNKVYYLKEIIVHSGYALANFEIRLLQTEGCQDFDIAPTCYKRKSNNYKTRYTITGCSERELFAARYVYLVLTGDSKQYLSEVRIHGTATVESRTAVATSSVVGKKVASLSVDGKLKTYSQTNAENPAWFCVELDKVYDFTELVIYNIQQDGSYANNYNPMQTKMSQYRINMLMEGKCDDAGLKRSKTCYSNYAGTKSFYKINSCNANRYMLFSAKAVFITKSDGKPLHFAELLIFGQENLAYKRQGSMSSVQSKNHELSVDGNRETWSETKRENPAWWCVQLDRVYDLTDIVIYSRRNSQGINGFKMKLSYQGSCNAATMQKATMCYQDRSTGGGLGTVYNILNCNMGGSLAGSIIFLIAEDKSMSFSEISIHGQPNLAIGHLGAMSSEEKGRERIKSIDGIQWSVAQSEKGKPGWWCVQLDVIYEFSEIIIGNIINSKTTKEMEGFEIRLLNSGECNEMGYKGAKVCHKDTTGIQTSYTVNRCTTPGTFYGGVVFVVNTKDRVIIRDIWIHGTVKYKPVEVGKKQPSASSSVSGGQLASFGNDDNKDTFFKSNDDDPSWWCVALNNLHILHRIVISNLKTSGLEIRVADYSRCHAHGFKRARSCYKDTTSGLNKDKYNVYSCSQGGEFTARYVYINTVGKHSLTFTEVSVIGREANPIVNVALNALSVSSSMSDMNSRTSLGNDGNRYSGFSSKESDTGAWWCVQLANIYDFQNIKLVNNPEKRGKHYGIELRVSTSDVCNADELKKARICRKDTRTDEEMVFKDCNQGDREFTGKTVYVSNTVTGPLYINELEAYGVVHFPLQNMAYKRFALQSSMNGFNANMAVDGDISTCSRTRVETNSWLCVDLESVNVLDNIEIIQARRRKVTGYKVSLGKHSHCSPEGFKTAELCYKDTNGGSYVQMCNQGDGKVTFTARTVYISAENKGLSVCEVMVRAVKGPMSYCTVP